MRKNCGYSNFYGLPEWTLRSGTGTVVLSESAYGPGFLMLKRNCGDGQLLFYVSEYIGKEHTEDGYEPT
jgi:hypothetical protein